MCTIDIQSHMPRKGRSSNVKIKYNEADYEEDFEDESQYGDLYKFKYPRFNQNDPQFFKDFERSMPKLNHEEQKGKFSTEDPNETMKVKLQAIVARSETGVDIYAPLEQLSKSSSFQILDWPGKPDYGQRIYRDNVTLYDGVYSGDFNQANALRTGQGHMNFNDGDVYDGWWIDGLKHGMGRQISKDGIYLGLWTNDEKSCGTQLYPDGSIYVGQWFNGVQWGRGYMKYADGSQYEGQWVKNKHHGHGTLFY